VIAHADGLRQRDPRGQRRREPAVLLHRDIATNGDDANATVDYYEVLGVSRGAMTRDQEVVPAACPELHPDVNRHDPGAEDKLRRPPRLTRCVRLERRATYDRYGHEGLRSGGYAPNFDGIRIGGGPLRLLRGFRSPFGDIFGGGDALAVRRRAAISRRSRDLLIQAAAAIARRWYGCARTTATVNGAEPGTPDRDVRAMRRSGPAARRLATPFGQVVRALVRRMPRRRASRSRSVPRLRRAWRRGRAKPTSRSTFRLGSPTGSGSGSRTWSPGDRGDPAGTCTSRFRVREDSRFVRDGDDLDGGRVAAPLAALGTTVEVPTVGGSVELEIPAGTQPHETLRIRGEGMPSLRGRALRRSARDRQRRDPETAVSASSASYWEQLAESMTEDQPPHRRGRVREDPARLRRLILEFARRPGPSGSGGDRARGAARVSRRAGSRRWTSATG